MSWAREPRCMTKTTCTLRQTGSFCSLRNHAQLQSTPRVASSCILAPADLHAVAALDPIWASLLRSLYRCRVTTGSFALHCVTLRTFNAW